MRSFWAIRATPYYPTRIHPALTSFADECFSTLARLLAYLGVLALLATIGIHPWDELLAGLAGERHTKMGWSVAVRSYPAFAVSQFDSPEKTETYQTNRNWRNYSPAPRSSAAAAPHQPHRPHQWIG